MPPGPGSLRLRCYALLLWLCPPGFRRRWSGRMVETLRERAIDEPAGSLRGEAGFWLGEYADALRTALREWARRGIRPIGLRRGSPGADLRGDLRQAIRGLWRRPVLAAVVVATAALGIGANALTFSIVHAVLIRPLPLPEPERLVHATGSFPANDRAGVSPPDYLDYRARLRSFSGLSATLSQELQIAGGGERAALVRGWNVSHEIFETLGVAPLLGRGFRAEEETDGRGHVVVVSYGLWQSRFGGRHDVLGSTLMIGGVPHEIVGVMPPGFAVTEPVEIWKPLPFGIPDTSVRRFHFLRLIGRLAPGVDRASAQAEVNAVAAALEAAYPDSNEGWSLALRPLRDEVVRRVDEPLLALTAAVGLLLLIVCTNLAGVLLARHAARGGEVALRAALGASRWRLARLVLVESLVLASLGGLGGLGLAWGGLALFKAMADPRMPRLHEIGLDASVLGFAGAVTLLAGLLFGLAPALRARRADLAGALHSLGGRSSDSLGSRRLQAGLVVAQVALSLVLLIGAGATLQSLARLHAVDPGFVGERVVTASWSLPRTGYEEPGSWRGFYDALLERVRDLPGTVAAGAIDGLPLASANDTEVYPEGRPPERQADRTYAQVRSATPGYFEALSIPLLAGRGFESRDDGDHEGVAVVSASLARRLFGAEGAVGRRMSVDLGEPVGVEIVGVVGDVHNFSLAAPADEGVYLPFAQQPGSRMSVVLRTGLSPADALESLRALGSELAPGIPTSQDTALDALVDASTAIDRWRAIGIGAFATLALALAALGLYGVLAQAVQRREREMGVRAALGASPRQIRNLIVSEGLRLVAAGVALGLPFAAAAAVVAERSLYGVRASEPAPFVAVAGLLLAMGWTASRIPARRAMRVDPSHALRGE